MRRHVLPTDPSPTTTSLTATVYSAMLCSHLKILWTTFRSEIISQLKPNQIHKQILNYIMHNPLISYKLQNQKVKV